MLIITFWSCFLLGIIFFVLFAYNLIFYKNMLPKSFSSPSEMQVTFGKLFFWHVLFGFLTAMLFLVSVILGTIWIVQKFSSV